MGRRLSGSSQARGRFSQSLRRRTGWEVGPGGTATLAIAAPQQSVLGSGVQSVEDGLTVARIRGMALLYLTSTDIAVGGFAGALGIGVTDAAAFAIGSTALQMPLTEEDWDGWMWHSYFEIRTAAIMAGGAATDDDQILANAGVQRFVIDSKAMRKFDEDSVVYAAIETTETGVSSMQVGLNTRMLLMLP